MEHASPKPLVNTPATMSSKLHLSKFFPKESEENDELVHFREECEVLISVLPSENGLRLYRGFWFPDRILQALLSIRRHYEPSPDDILLVTYPKSGTTWLKALAFSVLNRRRFPLDDRHPLLTVHPHDCVPFLESLFSDPRRLPDLRVLPSPRLLATHVPCSLLPAARRRVVYLLRDPKDVVVSMWHFTGCHVPMGAMVEEYCRGTTAYGPMRDHVGECRRESARRPEEVMVLEYEELAEDAEAGVRRLAAFLGMPFSAEEEEGGAVGAIARMCSLDFLRGLEVNKVGTRGEEAGYALDNSSFFRRGNVGDWKECLTPEMAGKIDQAMQQKLDD